MAPKRKNSGADKMVSPKKARPAEEAEDDYMAYTSDLSDDVVNFTEQGELRADSEARRQWNYVCTYKGCKQRFNRPCRLEAHMRSHNNERPFACPIDGCDKTFPRKDHVQRHLKNSHAEPERNFACDWEGCNKSFTSQGRLRRHMDVHNSKFYCTVETCKEGFKLKKTLDAHIKSVHLASAKPYACTFVDPETKEPCLQGYQAEVNLRTHMAKAHAGKMVRSHLCMICIPPGTDSTTFTNHFGKITTIPKEPLSFASQEELQAHSNEYHPPVCPICNLKLKDHANLKSHYQTVHGDRSEQPQFPCPRPGCTSVFNRKNNLTVHIKAVHDEARTFFCTADVVKDSKHKDLQNWDGKNACGNPFKAKSSLFQHIRTHHLGLRNRKETRKAKSKKKPGLSSLSLLTGVGYDQGREIKCVFQDCEYAFYRVVDLRRHLSAEHGLSEDEAWSAAEERDATSGGQFWIGGLDEPISQFDSADPSVPHTPMPYFPNQAMQSAMQTQTQMPMQNGQPKSSSQDFNQMFEAALLGLDTTDPDSAALDAAMGLTDLPPAVNVHDGFDDSYMHPVDRYLNDI